MRIVISSLYLPYPSVPHGGGHDLFRLIALLGGRHEVHVVAFADDAQAAHADELRDYCASVTLVRPAVTWRAKVSGALAAVRVGRWRLLGRRADAEMREHLARLGREADVLQCEWTSMGRYLRAAGPRPLRVLDEVDVSYLVAEDAAARAGGLEGPWLEARARRLRERELGYCRDAQLVLARSTHDAAELVAACPEVRTFVLPPVAHVREYVTIPAETPGAAPIVLFVGALDRGRNIRAAEWLCRQVWPRVHAACPEAELHLVGANPGPAIQVLAEVPGVRVVGHVPDLRPHYAAAAVVAAPLQSAAGALNKVLDGLAAGRPVVATTAANAGIGAALEREILVRDMPETFSAALVVLLQAPARRALLGAAGRAFVQRAFDWPARVMELEALYGELTTQSIGSTETELKT